MRTIAIGDIHGRNTWKKIIEHEKPDRIIFIGDYFDSFDIPAVVQIDNFRAIMELKGDVIWLIGNHDLQYYYEITKTCNGYQETKAPFIGSVVNQFRKKLLMAYQMDDLIFTHAGITKTFLYDNRIPEDEFLVGNINRLFKMRPNVFSFRLGQCQDEVGNDVNQGPLWVRPPSLMLDSINSKQVVGHTGHQRLTIVDDKFFFIDTLGKSEDYLVIIDGEVTVGVTYNY